MEQIIQERMMTELEMRRKKGNGEEAMQMKMVG